MTTEWEARLSAAELDELQCQLETWEGELTEPEADWSKPLRELKHAVQYELLKACLNRDAPKLGRIPVPPKPVQPLPPPPEEVEVEGEGVDEEQRATEASHSDADQHDLRSTDEIDDEKLYTRVPDIPGTVDDSANGVVLFSSLQLHFSAN